MPTYRLALMEGDGIGPEIVGAARDVFEAAAKGYRALGGGTIEWTDLPIGLAALDEHGSTLPARTFDVARDSDGIVLGPLSTHLYDPEDPRTPNPSKVFRTRLDLFANVRPVRGIAVALAGRPAIDIVVVRENTEGFYADRNLLDGNGEFRPDPNTVLSLRLVTRAACERIARHAFDVARQRGGRKRVTAAHKANVLRRGCGLFLEVCRTVAEDYPDVTFDDAHVDALTLHLVTDPTRFDVIVATNMFGDILSDLIAGFTGGLGAAPGLNAGDRHAMAQAVHGSAPDIAGRGVANPVALVWSFTMLLEWLSARHSDAALARVARDVRAAVDVALGDSRRATPDVGGTGSTTTIGRAIADAFAAGHDADTEPHRA